MIIPLLATGLFVAWLASKSPSVRPELPKPSPVTPKPVPAIGPKSSSFPQVLVPKNGKIDLIQNAKYEADIQLSGLDRLASASMVASKLVAKGFAGVKVSDLGEGAYSATGYWPSASTSGTLPKQIDRMVRVG